MFHAYVNGIVIDMICILQRKNSIYTSKRSNLVLNGLNLVFAIYYRIIGNHDIKGKANGWVYKRLEMKPKVETLIGAAKSKACSATMGARTSSRRT